MGERESAKDDFDRLIAAESERGLGSIDLFKHRALTPFSRGTQEAASNLLSKASDAIVHDDIERAERLVRRALDLPFDEAEDVVPAAWEAHLMLYVAVTDAAEESEPPDEVWLDAALLVMAEADPWGAAEMYEVLKTVLQDTELTARERKRLLGALRSTPRLPAMESVDPDDAEFSGRIFATLRVAAAFDETFAAFTA